MSLHILCANSRRVQDRLGRVRGPGPVPISRGGVEHENSLEAVHAHVQLYRGAVHGGHVLDPNMFQGKVLRRCVQLVQRMIWNNSDVVM